MARVKGALNARKRHKKILKLAIESLEANNTELQNNLL